MAIERKIGTILDAIERAENDGGKLQFTYHGLPRIVQPYLVGMHNGLYWRLLAYQVARPQSRSEHGTLPGWRCFDLAEMTVPRVIEKHVPWERVPPKTTEQSQKCINFITEPRAAVVEEDDGGGDEMFTYDSEGESENEYVPN